MFAGTLGPLCDKQPGECLDSRKRESGRPQRICPVLLQRHLYLFDPEQCDRERAVNSGPDAFAIDGSGNLWVADGLNNRVQKLSGTGTYQSQLGCSSGACSSGSGNGQFNFNTYPNGVAIDGSGNIWVADADNYRVQKFSSGGTYASQFGSQGNGNGQFEVPGGIAIDASGNIWVADGGENNRVQEFSATGTYEFQFGCPSGAPNCYAGSSSNGQFSNWGPGSIAIDASGNLWVVDYGNSRVQEFNASGTYESQLGCPSDACSTGTSNGQFGSGPNGLAIDGSGNIWVGISGNNRVEEFSSGGTYKLQLGCSSDACSSGPAMGSSILLMT